MQNERIFFAPSLAEVIKQLIIYRPTGVLTLWQAGGARQEDVRITIEHGRLLHVFWGSYKESASESILRRLNSWGAIHFSFLSTEHRLQLPAPSQTAQEISQQEERSKAYSLVNNDPVTAIAHETVIVSLTTYGKSYAIANLPRYDRTIFLLINGRRSVVNLSQLTKRSLEEVYTTLYRLRNLQLIKIEAHATKLP